MGQNNNNYQNVLVIVRDIEINGERNRGIYVLKSRGMALSNPIREFILSDHAHPIFHSDQGFQYTSKQFKINLDMAGITQSMSRVGRCIDNGPMEGFWGILKCEMYYLCTFKDYDSLVEAIRELHIFLQLRTPTKEVEQNVSDEVPSVSRNRCIKKGLRGGVPLIQFYLFQLST